MDKNKQDWLTVKDVATELGFSATTVYGWLENGSLVGHRIAGSWRVKRHDLDAFIDVGRNVPAQAQEQEGVTQ
ncbi:MAG: helix-turn-helix domain-containing protein [Anaerolineae bacterium]